MGEVGRGMEKGVVEREPDRESIWEATVMLHETNARVISRAIS
jgi:hypothetical protein